MCTQSPQMFHNYATPWHIYITADKLCSNKLLCSEHPHIWRQTAVPPAGWNPGWCQLVCLNFFKHHWVPEFPHNSWPIGASTCQPCQMRAHIGHGTAKIGSQPPSTIFRSLWQRPSNWNCLTAVSVSQEKYTLHAMRLHHSAMWNRNGLAD
jgi:hypothetical protein